MPDLRRVVQVPQPAHEAPLPIPPRETGEAAKDTIVLTILAPETPTRTGTTTTAASSAIRSPKPGHQSETGAVPAGSSLQPARPAPTARLCRARPVCHLHGGDEAAGGRAGTAAAATRPGTGFPAAAAASAAERRGIGAAARNNRLWSADSAVRRRPRKPSGEEGRGRVGVGRL